MSDQPDPNATDKVIAFHLPSLLTHARVFAQTDPGMRVVGLVADEGTQEAALLKSRGTELTTDPDQSVSALVSREIAKDILLDANPQVMEWLFHDWVGSQRILPVIRSARHGIRTAAFSYSWPGPAREDQGNPSVN